MSVRYAQTWLIATALFIGNASGVEHETIAPEHSIPFARTGWLKLSNDGRWLSHKYVAKSGERPVTLYDLNHAPVAKGESKELISSGHFSANGRWSIKTSYPNHSDDTPRLYELWDLHDQSGAPILSLQSETYSSFRINGEGTHVAAIATGEDGAQVLRLLDLTKPPIVAEGFLELGEIEGRVARSTFLFTANRGLIAISNGRLTRWNIDEPREPPISIPINSQRVSVVHSRWLSANAKTRNVKAVYWNDEENKDTVAYITDLPQKTVGYRVWKVQGRPVAYADGLLVERREDGCWITRFTEEVSESTRLFKPCRGTLYNVLPLMKRQEVLVTHSNTFMDGILIGFQTYLASLQDGVTSPRLLESEGDVTSSRFWGKTTFDYSVQPRYAINRSEKWLVALSDRGNVIWDMSIPFAQRESKPLLGAERNLRHVVVNDRWLILLNRDGRLSAVDLEANEQPSAVEFFQVPAFKSAGRLEAAGNRFYVSNSKQTYVWNVDVIAQRIPTFRP